MLGSSSSGWALPRRQTSYARNAWMVLLSEAVEPQAIPTSLYPKDPEQPLLRGRSRRLCRIGGPRPGLHALGASRESNRFRLASALLGFLKDEPEAFWYAQFRALEALAVLRQPTATTVDNT